MDQAEVERAIMAMVSDSRFSAQDKMTGWEISGARVVSARGELSLVVSVGEWVRVQVALRGPRTGRTLKLRAALVDRLDRTITSMCAEVAPRTILYVKDHAKALAFVDIPLAVTPGDYAVVLEVLGGSDNLRAPVQVGPIVVHWDKPWMPFWSLVGLPTSIGIAGRTRSAETLQVHSDQQV